MDLPQHFLSQIINFILWHQIQDKFKKLGKYSLWSCISMSSTSSNGILVERLHQRENPRPMIVFCWAWLEREAKAPTSLKTPQMQSIGQCMLALWNLNIIYPHPDMKLFFLRAISAGFQAGELGEIHFGLGTTPVK